MCARGDQVNRAQYLGYGFETDDDESTFGRPTSALILAALALVQRIMAEQIIKAEIAKLACPRM